MSEISVRLFENTNIVDWLFKSFQIEGSQTVESWSSIIAKVKFSKNKKLAKTNNGDMTGFKPEKSFIYETT